jgi:hypothetical protein
MSNNRNSTNPSEGAGRGHGFSAAAAEAEAGQNEEAMNLSARKRRAGREDISWSLCQDDMDRQGFKKPQASAFPGDPGVLAFRIIFFVRCSY